MSTNTVPPAPRPHVVRLKRGEVVDGGMAEVELENSDGSVQLMRFNPSQLRNLFSVLFELDAVAWKKQDGSRTRTVATREVGVANSSGNDIYLMLRAADGLAAVFELQRAMAAETGRMLLKVADEGRADDKPPTRRMH